MCLMISVQFFFGMVISRVTVYNDPHLRTRVDLHQSPIRWIPANDFKDIFTFIDKSDTGDGSGDD